MALSLYRITPVRIGEPWIDRWTWGRGTGGLGTGLYSVRTRDTAQFWADREGRDVVELRDAVTNPIQPSTWDAMKAVNRYSRMLDRIHAAHQDGYVDLDAMIQGTPEGLRVKESSRDLRQRLAKKGGTQFRPNTVEDVKAPLNNALIPGVHVEEHPDRSPGLFSNKGRSLGHQAFKILIDTPELQSKYGFDQERFVRDSLRALRTARRDCPDPTRMGAKGRCSQPLNKLLWPEFDGVCPVEGAGGDSFDWGCVVLKEKIDSCLGRRTSNRETLNPETLNRRCFP